VTRREKTQRRFPSLIRRPRGHALTGDGAGDVGAAGAERTCVRPACLGFDWSKPRASDGQIGVIGVL